MVDKDFIYYKIILGSKHILPTQLINTIIDEYLDNRLKCMVCDCKFLDIEIDIDYGFARVCFICNKWVCENCSSTRIIYATNETFCGFCEYESYEEDDEESESDSDISDYN
jgi:hypothetical protein